MNALQGVVGVNIGDLVNDLRHGVKTTFVLDLLPTLYRISRSGENKVVHDLCAVFNIDLVAGVELIDVFERSVPPISVCGQPQVFY